MPVKRTAGGEVKIAQLGDWTSEERLSWDSGLAAWGDELFVCDPYRRTIRVFDLKGTLLRGWMCNVPDIRRIALDSTYVVVTCLSDGILMYGKHGRLVRALNNQSAITDVVIIANGEMYVTDRSAVDKGYVQIWTTEGENRGQFLCCSGRCCRTNALSASEEELYASCMYFDGYCWRSFVRAFQRDGVELRTIEYTGALVLDICSCITVDANGTLLLAGKEGEGADVDAWNPDGSVALPKWFPTDLPVPWSGMSSRCLSSTARLTVIAGMVRDGKAPFGWQWNRVVLAVNDLLLPPVQT